MNKFNLVIETANEIRQQPKAITAGAWWRELFQPMTALYQRVLDAVLREADIKASSEVLDAQIIRYREEGKAPVEVFNFLSSPQLATKPHFEAPKLAPSQTVGVPVTLYSDEEWELSHYTKQQVWVTETVHGCTVAGWRTQWVRDWELVKVLKAKGEPTEFTYAYWSEKSTAKRIMNTQEHHLREEGLSKEDLVLFAQECAHPDFLDLIDRWAIEHPPTEGRCYTPFRLSKAWKGVYAVYQQSPLGADDAAITPNTHLVLEALAQEGVRTAAVRTTAWDWKHWAEFKAQAGKNPPKTLWFDYVKAFFKGVCVARAEDKLKLDRVVLAPRLVVDAWANIVRSERDRLARKAAYEQRKAARMSA